MKKLLLGTSALVAAGLFSNGALAQTATTDTPVQFKIGGQYYAGIGAFVQQDDNPGEVAFKRNPIAAQDYFLIRFIGSTTFSNGITAGVFTRLNAFSAPNGTASTVSGFQSSNNTTIKDSYLYIKNAATWGEFRIGDDSDVRRNVATGNNAGAANGDGNLGANSGALQWLNTPVYNFTTMNLDSRGTKAVYYSPTIAGFQFGASFTPDKAGGHTYGPGNVGDNSGLTDRITNGLTPSYLNNQNAYNLLVAVGSVDRHGRPGQADRHGRLLDRQPQVRRELEHHRPARPERLARRLHDPDRRRQCSRCVGSRQRRNGECRPAGL